MSIRNLPALFMALVLGGLSAAFICVTASAQVAVKPHLTSPIDEFVRVTLKGNVPPLARAKYDKGAAPLSMPYRHILLVLRRSAQQEADLQAFLQSVQNVNSPNYHRWITPEQFGKLYGPADADIQTLKIWLEQHGFTVDAIPPGRTSIEFSGLVAQVEDAFSVEIHSFNVSGKHFYSNTTDPQIPAALAAVVSGIANLNTIKPSPMHHRGPAGRFDPESHRIVPAKGSNLSPQLTLFDGSGNPYLYMGPADAATIYDSPNSTLNPSYSSGNSYDGTGITIGIAGQSDVDLSAVASYRSFFGLPPVTPSVTVVGTDPGTVPDAEGEALLDLEVAGALAPGANLHFYTATNAVNAAYQAVQDNQVDILNVSFGACEAVIGASGNQFIHDMWQQAAAQGIAITVSSGDTGSAGCDAKDAATAGAGLAVNGLASTSYNIAVGGTDFDVLASSFNTYVDSSSIGSGPYYRTALGYIPEEPWNDSAVSSQSGLPPTTLSADIPVVGSNSTTDIVAAGGGASSCIDGALSNTSVQTSCAQGYAKPAWQRGAGVPTDGVRDVPDISLLAAGGAHFATWTVCLDAATSAWGQADCQLTNGVPTSSTTFDGIGGTSAASPAFAGMLALIQQKTGSRLGQAAQELYDLYNGANAGAIFHDVATGNISVPCAPGTADCATNAAGYNFLTGYDAAPGYDLASGLGSVDLANLVQSWGSTSSLAVPSVAVAPSALSIDYSETLNVTVTVAGTSGNPTPTGTVTLSSGLFTSSPSTLTNGSATIAVSGVRLNLGANTLIASYVPDSASASQYLSAVGSGLVTITGPVMSVSPASLTFSATVGQSSIPSQSISITNTSTGTLKWSADFLSAPWILCDSLAGTAPSTLNVSVNVSGLATGTYQGSITVMAMNFFDTPSEVTIPITLNVTGDGGGSGTGPFAYVTDGGINAVSVIDGSTNSVVSTIPVGTEPGSVALAPDGAFAYVANYKDDSVSVIETASGTLVATIAVGSFPNAVAVTPDGAFVYVVNYGNGSISVIAAASNTVEATIPVGNNPGGLAITPDGAFVYVTNSSDHSVSVIASASKTVVSAISLGSEPWAVAITPDGAFAYITDPLDNSVFVIPVGSNTVVATVPVGSGPFSVAITPDGAFVYVVNDGGNNVSVIETASNTVAATIPVGHIPLGVAFTPDGAFAYVTNSLDSSVSVVATATKTVIKTIPIGSGSSPTGIAFVPRRSSGPVLSIDNHSLIFNATVGGNNPASQAVSIANSGSGTLTWSASNMQSWLSLDSSNGTAPSTVNASVNIAGLAAGTYQDTITITATGASGSPTTIPVTLTVSGGGGASGTGPFAYVTNFGSNNVSVIDGSNNTVVAGVTVGENPIDIAITPDGALAYVLNAGSQDVSAIATATNTVVATIPVDTQFGGPNYGSGIAITPNGSFVYVANYGANSISVIATATNVVVASVSVEQNPTGVAITPDGSFAYVSNQGSNTVSVIATATNNVVASIPVGGWPGWLAITGNGAFAYVANQTSNTVSVISTATNTVVATVPVGGWPTAVAITPNGAFGYVTNLRSDSVSVISTATNNVVATVPVGGWPTGVAISSDGAFVYVVDQSDAVSVMATATNTVIDAIPLGSGSRPTWIAFAPIQPSAPVLSIDNQSLTFIATAGGNNPASQAISITNTGGGTLTWTASKTQSWLSLDTTSGTAPSTINASVDIAGLAPGTYHDTITITATGASGSPVDIPVTLTITANPTLSVDPLSLTFTATVGGSNPAAQPVSVANTGSGTLDWTASKTQSWLSLDNASGTAPSTIQVSVNITGLAAGTYNDTITIAATGASGSPQTIAVTLTVSSASTPDFKIDMPSGGNTSATVNAGGTASYGLGTTPLNGFTGAVSFTCSGLPSKSTCSFNPAPASITSTASVPFTVAIATTAAKTSAAGIFTGFGSSLWTILAGVIVLLANLWLLGFRTRKWRRLMMLMLLACAFGTISCGGGSSTSTPTPIPGTPAGTYNVVLTSTSGSITHTTSLTLTVQ